MSPGALLAILYFFSFRIYFSARLDFPSPPLSAPGSPRMRHDQLNINCKYSHKENAVNLGDAAIAFINGLKLLPLCDHILQAKDAGPRVGAFKTLRCQGFNTWTHMNRIHRAPHDSGQNEAERSQAAMGQAFVDGRALHWEYFQPTDLIRMKELRGRSSGAYCMESCPGCCVKNRWRA